MPFAGNVQAGEEYGDLMMAKDGVSPHGKTVKFDSAVLQVHDAADADKVSIVGDADGDAFHANIKAADSLDVSGGNVSVAFDIHYDGRPGEGVVDLIDSGIVTFTQADAATPGAVTFSTKPIA